MRTASRSLLLIILPLLFAAAVANAATLIGFAELPADTFRPGPTSGNGIEAANEPTPPYINQQPVQGFSALLKGPDNSFYALSDNGFGRRENSDDYLLSIYRVTADFRTVDGGAGHIAVTEVIHLSDPHEHTPYPLTRPADRLLTGADLDPESFQQLTDGSFWIGEEFNPSLMHVSPSGELMSRPVTLEGLASVGNPRGKSASLPRSKGFEGMAMSPDQQLLYPMLEGPMLDSGPALNIYTFDIHQKRFLNAHANEPSYRYRLDEASTAIGEFTLYSPSQGLIIERDSAGGEEAVSKKIYRVDFHKLDEQGFLEKELVADLLDIDDPHDLNEDGERRFRFSFWTIEGLLVFDQTTLAVVNDNNYPFGRGRNNTEATPEATELILIRVQPLWD